MNSSQHPYKRIYDIADSHHRGWLSGEISFDTYKFIKNQFEEKGWLKFWRGAWKTIDRSRWASAYLPTTDDIPF